MSRDRPIGELSDSQMGVLIQLDLNGTRTASQLSELQRITPPAITRIVADLESRGYLARTRSSDDARSMKITITDSGRQQVNDWRRWHNEWVEGRLHSLNDEENAILRAATPLLRHLADD